MSIVLPKRKKKTDIFAPRKSVQDAKAKLGPAFFDPSLLECSRNAVELNKLVNKWEDIDKQKVKLLRGLSREQNALASSFKRNHSFNELTAKDESSAGQESLDGKPIPPGFRFKSNGDLKASVTSLPHVSLSISDTDSKSDDSYCSLTARKSSKSCNKSYEEHFNYNSVDYNKEITKLRDVIVDICEELSKSRISLSKSNSGKLKSFLRAHSNEYISVSDFTGEFYDKPNDRFAFQPGSSGKRNLHKQTIKTPSCRSCVGCQFKLKQQSDEFEKQKLNTDQNILKRRWSYVPVGKYVSSSASLDSSTHLLKSPSLHFATTKESNTREHQKPSLVQFKVDSEINPRKAVSFQTKERKQAKTEGRTKSSPCVRHNYMHSATETEHRETSSATQVKTLSDATKISALSGRRILESSLLKKKALKSGSSATSDTFSRGRSLESSLSVRGRGLESSLSLRHEAGSRHSARLLADYDSRLNLLKDFQAQEQRQCETKVKRFLKDIDSLGKTT